MKGVEASPLLINIVKLYNKKDYKSFYAFGRIISGKIKKGEQLRVMGENFMSGDEEDVFVREAMKLYVLQGRYRIEVSEASAGSLVLI